MKRHTEAAGLAVVLPVTGLFFMFTNPRTLASPFLVIGFLLLFAAILLALRLLLSYTGLNERLPIVASRMATWGLAGLAVVFLALQSIGQLTTRDVITVLALFLTVGFYMWKTRGRG